MNVPFEAVSSLLKDYLFILFFVTELLHHEVLVQTYFLKIREKLVIYVPGAYFRRLNRPNEVKASLKDLEVVHLNEPKLERYWFRIILAAVGGLGKMPGYRGNKDVWDKIDF